MEISASLRLLVLGVAVIVNGILALLVFKNNPKSATNRVYTLLSLVISFWLIANYISLHPAFLNTSLFWIRLSIFFATPLSALFFLLAHTLPKNSLQLGSKKLAILLFVTVVTMIVTVSPYAFTGVEIVNNSPRPTSGPGIGLFSLVSTLFSILAVYTLIKKLRKSTGFEKEQFRYVMLGILLMLGLIIVTVLLPVIFFKVNIFVTFIPVYTLVFLAMTTYAILKHRLLDIRLVVARTVSFTLLVTVIGFLYALLFAFLSSIFIGVTFELRVIAIFTLLTLLMAFSFQPIRRILEKITDKVLYKDKYDTSKLLYDLALVMASTLRLEDLTHQLLKTLLSQMRISRGAFIMTERGRIYDVAHEGYDVVPELSEQEVNILVTLDQVIILEDIAEGNVKNILKKLDLSMVIPLHTGGEDIVLLSLGEKLSGDIYTSEDIRVLEILAPEAAVAIQNAKAYEEIRRFNITLQEEVDKATKDLQIANERLKELDKLKDDFVSVTSHELRTPMTAIRSYTWMALHKSDIPLSQKLERYLYRTLISTERLINLVNDMLNVSRIESGRIEINPQALDMITLVKDTMEEVHAKSDEKELKIIILEDKIPQVFADADKVHEVLLNLIGNSIKFTPPGGTITVGFFSDGQVVEISVKDSGAGIAKEDLGRLFSKFGRLDNSYVSISTSGGTGLGLYISKSLVELMHGRIWAESEGQGKGATFTFSLPVANAEILSHADEYKVRAKGEAKGLEPVAI